MQSYAQMWTTVDDGASSKISVFENNVHSFQCRDIAGWLTRMAPTCVQPTDYNCIIIS